MRILVTGASGFIGFDLVNRLVKNNDYTVFATDRTKFTDTNFDNNVNYIQCELKDIDSVQQLPSVDCVIHLAAFNGTKFFYEKPFDVIKDNIVSTINLLDKYIDDNIQFIYSGTPEATAGATELGQPLPTTEESPLVVTDPTNLRWSYAGSKALGEQAVISSGLDWKIIRYNNVYGPRQKDHFIPEFINRLENGKAELFGHANTRTFLHINDAVDATIAVLQSDTCKKEIVNIGGPIETTIKEVAEKICTVMNIDASNMTLHDAPEGSAMRRWPSIDKIKKLTGWYPKISLEEGLRSLFYK
jgi:nucleoside-diphosphate-sugar epimerase